MKTKNVVFGRHPVLEALKSGKGFDKLMVLKTAKSPEISEITGIARAQGVSLQYVPIQKLNAITGKNHQGVIGLLSLVDYYKWDDVLMKAYDEGRSPIFLLLDHITDVGNFGAIARTALGAGVDAIIIPTKGGATISGDAIKSSAGALANIQVCRVEKLEQVVDDMKVNGITILAADMKATALVSEQNFTGPCCIILGSEESGVSGKLLKKCDAHFKLPMTEILESYNVSVSVGMILYETMRQRLQKD